MFGGILPAIIAGVVLPANDTPAGGGNTQTMTGVPAPTLYHRWIGWDAAALTFLLAAWPIIIRADSSHTPQLAAREDQTEGSARVLLVGAGVASLLGWCKSRKRPGSCHEGG